MLGAQDKANDEHKKRLEQALQAAQQLLRRQDVLVHDQLTSVSPNSIAEPVPVCNQCFC